MAAETSVIIALSLQIPGLNGRKGLPVILWGEPGIAKTAQIRAICKQLKRGCETVIASCREPQDFVGLPMRTDAGAVMVPPRYAKKAAEERNAVIFYDEGSSAPPAVQAAMLRVVNEGVIGDLELPEGVSFILAANPPTSAAGGWDLPAPMANRLVHIDVGCPTPRQWGNWLMSGDASIPAVPILTDEAWDREWRRVRAIGAGYMDVRTGQLHQLPAEDAKRGRAWPSPRSWEMGLRGWAGGLAVGNQEAAEDLLFGSIGTAAGVEFLTWVVAQDLPNPREWLTNPDLVKLDKQRLDRALAILASIAAEATTGPLPSGTDRAHYIEAAYTCLQKASNYIPKDVIGLTAKQIQIWRQAQNFTGNFGPVEKNVLLSVRDMLFVGGGYIPQTKQAA